MTPYFIKKLDQSARRTRDSDRYMQTTQMARLSAVIAEMEYEAKYRKEKSDA